MEDEETQLNSIVCITGHHWYAGVYSGGMWIYNKCSYCGKIENK